MTQKQLGLGYVSLGKKRTLAPATQLLMGNIVICVWQGTAEKQPLADAVLPGKITFKKKKNNKKAFI